jgi:hypothetical protein
MRAITFTFHGDLMDPQEGDIADLPDGRTAVYQGGRWVVQGGQPQAQSGPAGIPGFVPFQSPSDRRADQRLDMSAQSEARQAAAAERSVENDARNQGRQNVQSETDLRKEFLSQPDAKDFPLIASAYGNVVATARNDSAAGDLSLIFAFMKILDPNSVVREQEFANAQNAASVPDQIRNAYNRVLSGERLNPNQRADFVRQAQSVYGNRLERYNGLAERYRGLAESYGFMPDRVALVEAMPEQPAPTTARAAEGDGVAKPVTGRVQQYEGAAYVPTFSGPGSSPDEPFVLQRVEPNSEADYDQRRALYALPRGAFISNEGQIFRMTAEAYPSEGGAVDPNLGGVNLRETNMGDNARAFGMAAMEQIPFGDEAVQAAAGAISGRGFSDTRDSWQAAASIDNQASRGYRVAGGLSGAGLTMVAPGGGVAGKFLANAPKGAAVVRGMMVGGGSGALYGAGAADGGVQDRLAGARDGGLVGAMTGGALAGGGRRIGEMANTTPPQAGTRAAQVQILRDNGVSLTPGQQLGGVVKTAEDLAMRAPILGTAIKGARARGVESMNRARGNSALDHIGEGVPANIPAGGPMVDHVQGRLGAEFDRAYAMVPEINVQEPALLDGLSRIGRAKHDLPAPLRDQFDSIVSARLERLQGAVASGETVGGIRSELNTLAGGYLKATDPGQQALGRMIAELGDELDGAITRANPAAGAILQNARTGYGEYIQIERASTAANGRPFSPGQLENAVKASDNSVRHGAMGRGNARGQEFANAARTVMPDQFGNPGSADAIAGGALAVNALHAPITTTAIAGGLTAAATPYFMMARNVVDRLPANASRRQIEAAAAEIEQLATKDSNVIILRDEIARRLGAASGIAGGNAPQATERLMTGTRSASASPR